MSAAMEFSGSAGWTSGVSAEILTERLRRGSGPLGPRSLKHGSSSLAKCAETVLRMSMLRCRNTSASSSLTTVSPRRSMVVARPSLAFFLSCLTRSAASLPATNWLAMSTTWAFTGAATRPGANDEAARPALRAGLSSTALSPRYSCRWRTISAEDSRVGRTSTKRKSWVLNAGSFIAQSMRRA